MVVIGTNHAEASAPCQALTADTHLELGKGDFGLAGGDLVKQVPKGGGTFLHIGFYHHYPPHVPVPLCLQAASLQLQLSRQDSNKLKHTEQPALSHLTCRHHKCHKF